MRPLDAASAYADGSEALGGHLRRTAWCCIQAVGENWQLLQLLVEYREFALGGLVNI
jgi:hypothetical protein